MNFETPRRRASSRRTKTPRTSVSMNEASPSSERSTWVSAAKLTTASQPSMATPTTSGSTMSPRTNRYSEAGRCATSARFAGLAAYVSLSRLTTETFPARDSRTWRMKLDPMKPQPPVTKSFMESRGASYDPDLRIVADQEPVDAGPLRARMDADVFSDQRIRDARRDPLEPRALEDDGVLDLAAVDEAARADRGVGADEGVADLGAGTDDRGPADRTARKPRSRLDHDLALDLAAIARALDASGRERVEDD